MRATKTDQPARAQAAPQNHPRRQRGWFRVVLSLIVVILAVALVQNWSNIVAYVTHDIASPDVTAETLPISSAEPFSAHLAVAGDVGTGGDAEYRTASVMDDFEQVVPYDALLLLGDNVYEDGDASDVGERVLDPFADVLDGGTELVAVLGNHDVRDDNGPEQAAALGMPGPWYTQEVGDVLIVALDSTRTGDAEQLAWLEATLAADRPPWTVAIMHHPAYSAGWHGSNDGVRDRFVPLFEEYGVDLVFSGHDHDYQRSKPINGVTYVVTGAAAKLRRTSRDVFTEVAWSTYSFVDLVAYEDRLFGQAIDHDGRSIDSFEISR